MTDNERSTICEAILQAMTSRPQKINLKSIRNETLIDSGDPNRLISVFGTIESIWKDTVWSSTLWSQRVWGGILDNVKKTLIKTKMPQKYTYLIIGKRR